MAGVHIIHVGLGGSEFRDVQPALPLGGPDTSPMLCRRFRQLLLDTPLHFLEDVELRDHPLIRLQWVALCRTAGLLLLRSGSAMPDVYALLLNGLEDADEREAIERHCPMFRPHWQTIASEPRPIAVAGYLTPAHMQDRGVTTTLGAFANTFFTLLGQG